MLEIDDVPQSFINNISDGCSVWPDLWYKSCCYVHDYAAYIGSNIEESNVELLMCVAGEAYNDYGVLGLLFLGIPMGLVMFLGLQAFQPIYRKIKDSKDNKEI